MENLEQTVSALKADNESLQYQLRKALDDLAELKAEHKELQEELREKEDDSEHYYSNWKDAEAEADKLRYALRFIGTMTTTALDT